ncbi:Ataxin-7-like protein 3 [Vitis vinifera]|uniref:SAGA-associated factor 11 n=1 Tax=Vitis vinifera TaxID=29760 RepID=A0A438FAW6_VITVI|nr:Ataxin-7-like protein 3 [Vitis vinifera]
MMISKVLISDLTGALLTALSSHFFGDLLDSIIVDVASECHRIARLGLDRNLEEEEEELRLSAQARVSEIFECMNCGRSIMAGRFAPHLEKCMGKGRKARLKATRSSTAAQNRYHEAVLFPHTPLIQIPPAQAGYRMEHLVLEVRSTPMAHWKSRETNLKKCHRPSLG